MRLSVEERFWSKVDKRGTDECWEWAGCRMPDGYGRFRVRGRSVLSHRYAYESQHGAFSEGMCGLHKCDNPPCCNPNHIFPGTRVDNNADRDAKGRQAHTQGTRNGRAKLSAEDVSVIRTRCAAGGSYSSIAQSFGVTPPIISRINRGLLWRHAA